jgi:IS30 family transposase
LKFYSATTHHAWERGTNENTNDNTNENTNGLIHQYLPKGTSVAKLTEHACDVIATKPNP